MPAGANLTRQEPVETGHRQTTQRAGKALPSFSTASVKEVPPGERYLKQHCLQIYPPHMLLKLKTSSLHDHTIPLPLYSYCSKHQGAELWLC